MREKEATAIASYHWQIEGVFKMFNIGSLARSLVNPISIAQLALGPAGWASLAMRTLGPQLAMNLLQQVGQRMGLPQQSIDLAQGIFASAMGQPGLAQQNLAQSVAGIMQGGFSAREIAQTQREAASIVRQMTDTMLERLRNGDDREEGGVRGGESRLVALARALGKVMDGKMNEMIDIGNKIDKSDKTGELSAQMQALSQELALVASALNNTIKSVGEANTNMARKS
jgi:hypothetical protein